MACASEGERGAVSVLQATHEVQLDASAEAAVGLPPEWSSYLGFGALQQGPAPDSLEWSDERLKEISATTYSGTFRQQSALYSLTLSGRDEGRWFVLIEQPAGSSSVLASKVDVVDGEETTTYLPATKVRTRVASFGEAPSEAVEAHVPTLPTQGGFHTLVDPSVLMAAGAGSETAAQALDIAQARTRGAFSLLLDAAESHPELGPLLMSVVRKPGLVQIIRYGGVVLEILAPEGDVVPATVHWPGVGELRAAAIPGLILANGTRALEVEWIAVEPVGPLTFVSGIVQLIASHPEDPGNSVEMRLIGVRTFDAPTQADTGRAAPSKRSSGPAW